MIQLPKNIELVETDRKMSRTWFETLMSIFKTKADVTPIKTSEVPSGAVKVKLYFDGQNIYIDSNFNTSSIASTMRYVGGELLIDIP